MNTLREKMKKIISEWKRVVRKIANHFPQKPGRKNFRCSHCEKETPLLLDGLIQDMAEAEKQLSEAIHHTEALVYYLENYVGLLEMMRRNDPNLDPIWMEQFATSKLKEIKGDFPRMVIGDIK